MQRIAIIGCAGTGKSTLSKQLGELLNLPVNHLDRLFWHAGWVETPKDEWMEINLRLVQEDSWILEGNYISTMDIRIAAADTVIFLDLPRRICLFRVLKRRLLNRNRTRADMADGCLEKLDLAFLKWIWHFPKRKRPTILQLLSGVAGGKTMIHLKSAHAVRSFLQKIRNATAP